MKVARNLKLDKKYVKKKSDKRTKKKIREDSSDEDHQLREFNNSGDHDSSSEMELAKEETKIDQILEKMIFVSSNFLRMKNIIS